MINRILIVAALFLAVFCLDTVQAQEEATMRLTATVLPSSGAGNATGIVIESAASENQADQQGTQLTDGPEGGEPGTDDVDAGGQPTVGDDNQLTDLPRRKISRKQMALTGFNQVLVEVQTPSSLSRSIVSFPRTATERVDVGTLEESTTVDVIHLSI